MSLGVIFVCSAVSSCLAQDQPQVPALQQNPIAALQAFEPAADAPYQLGHGDDISVEVLGRPELTSKHTIGPDGSITMPIVGAIKIAGKTRDEAAGAIKASLDPYYSGIAVSVGVDKYSSNELLVLGAVVHPGPMIFDSTPTLLQAISRAGVTTSGNQSVNSGNPATQPTGIPEEVMIYRGDNQMVTVELRALLDSGSPLANMRLKRDDIVYVAGKTSYVSILGFVGHPGNQHLDPSTTLADLIAEAGGPTEKAGKNPTIEVIHRNGSSVGSTQNVNFQDILHKPHAEAILRSGDIIYIPQSGFNSASYTLQQLSPLVNLFTVAALFGNGTQ
jgi:polysaccharide export outer membrane protein